MSKESLYMIGDYKTSYDPYTKYTYGVPYKLTQFGYETAAPKGTWKANEKQVAGDHYKDVKYQPWDVVQDWGLGYLDGTALKYIQRWKKKGGVEDLKKAVHFLEKLIETEESK